ncbi:MAG: capsular polysaccharide export protein [Psychromonas sp.]|jgi:capsular polysaccharide export protein|uniref:capsule biosynthesis protein n=1 Tax=Psychromonas sp. TaxID=1884585 RepID=UPI0039E50725
MSHILFLQGPLGPFFKKFAHYASAQGHQTYKINFNGGDRHYGWADHEFDYVDSYEMWHSYLSAFVKKHHIARIVVYGDCRFYHKVAKQVTVESGIKFWAWEEGYLRAGFVTLEKEGCNANSSLFNDAESFKKVKAQNIKSSLSVGPTFARRTWFAFCYYTFLHFSKNTFAHYHHHRPWTPIQEPAFWLKGFAQKWVSKLTDPRRYKKIVEQYSGKLYLLPLQVEVDFQLRDHSRFSSVAQVVSEVMHSFALHADNDQALLIKHHPQNRGFAHYGKLIAQLADELNLNGRVLYGHDFHLPDVYLHAAGVVTVNSTVGISALVHHLPTVVLGRAIYDIEGITYPNKLDDFWQDDFKVDRKLFEKFRTYLCQQSQISGDFYKKSEKLIEIAYPRISDKIKSTSIEDDDLQVSVNSQSTAY